MPIYEYRCNSCGHEFEELQKVGAAPPVCPKCTADEAERMISQTSFVLKGGGWYKDLYSGPSNRKDGGSSSSSSGSSSSDSSSSGSSSSSSSSD